MNEELYSSEAKILIRSMFGSWKYIVAFILQILCFFWFKTYGIQNNDHTIDRILFMCVTVMAFMYDGNLQEKMKCHTRKVLDSL